MSESRCTGKFRDALDPHQGELVALPPDRGLAEQLGAATWKLRSDRIVIESKDEIRERLGMSPDDADVVVLGRHKRDQVVWPESVWVVPERRWIG